MHSVKKILIICQHFWPEAFRINDTANFFIEKKCDVDVLCGIPNYPSGKFTKGYSYFKNRKQIHKGISIRRVFEIPRGNNTNFRIFINYLSFPIASLLHVPRLLTKKYDKIFLYSLSPVMMSISGIIVGKIKKTETVMYVLDLWPENLFSVLDIKNKLMRKTITRISHWHYKNVDKFIVLSEQMKEKIITITGKASSSVLVLPQACEKIYERDIVDKVLTKRFSKRFNVLFTGNISPAQSFTTIIDAAKILKSRKVKDINWIIVGSGMSINWLVAEITKNNLNDCFFFEGQKPISDIPKYTTIADVLVGCLTKSELLEATIPAKVMSYIAAGRPIVLAMDGEVQDLINNKIKSGFVGPTEDAPTLANNIYKVYMMNKKQRNNLGLKSRKYHFKYFERNIIMGKLHNFLFN